MSWSTAKPVEKNRSPQAIFGVCIDVFQDHITGGGRHLPQAAITLNRFHCTSMANATLKEVRRTEVLFESALEQSRQLWLKEKRCCSRRQIAQHHDLTRSRFFRLIVTNGRSKIGLRHETP